MRACVATIAAVLTFAAPANAEVDVTSTPAIQYYLSAAYAHWGAAPPCAARVVLDSLPPGIRGMAYQDSCLIQLAEPLWQRTRRVHAMHWCTTVVHEVGHLLGHTHEEGGVMDLSSFVPHGCIQRQSCRRIKRRVRRCRVSVGPVTVYAWNERSRSGRRSNARGT